MQVGLSAEGFPPVMSFSITSLIVKLNGGPQQLLRVAAAATCQRPELPAVRTIVSHEELLQLSHRASGQIAQLPHFGLVHRGLGHRHQTIVADGPALFRLFSLEYPNQPNGQQTPDEARMVRDNRDIERVPIRRSSAGNGAEIAREMHAERHDPAELEQPQPRIVFVLVAAALRCIDDDVHEASLAPGRKAHSPVEGADGWSDKLAHVEYSVARQPTKVTTILVYTPYQALPHRRRRHPTGADKPPALIAPTIEFKVSSLQEGSIRGSYGSN